MWRFYVCLCRDLEGTQLVTIVTRYGGTLLIRLRSSYINGKLLHI